VCLIASSDTLEWDLVLWVVVVSVARALLSARRQCECECVSECSSAVEGITRAVRARRSPLLPRARQAIREPGSHHSLPHSRVAPLFQGTRTWICPGFPLSNMDARSEGCPFAQWDGHAEHRWWSVFFSLSDHAVITPLTTQHKPVGFLRSVQGNDMQFAKMCSPLVTHHHRWLGLLLLLLCVGYSHGMPHVLRFGKKTHHSYHHPLRWLKLSVSCKAALECQMQGARLLKRVQSRACFVAGNATFSESCMFCCRERYFSKLNFLSLHHTCWSCPRLWRTGTPCFRSYLMHKLHVLLFHILSFLNVLWGE